MADSLPLLIQRLGGFPEQTLVIAHIAELRSTDGTSSPRAIEDVFIRLRIQPPSNVSQYLSVLAERRLLLRVAPGRWALTPEGREEIRRLMSNVSDDELRNLPPASSDSMLGDARHYLLPPELAPARLQEGISRFLAGHAFDRNVFCMTRFPRNDDDPVRIAIDACRDACADLGLELHLASDRTVEEMLFGNIAAAMWASHYGIAIFEDRMGEGLNVNVALEVGVMLATGRRSLLLKDTSVERMPTDLTGHIYQAVDIANRDNVDSIVRGWIRDDLALVD